jgi:hypothetical protein
MVMTWHAWHGYQLKEFQNLQLIGASHVTGTISTERAPTLYCIPKDIPEQLDLVYRYSDQMRTT